MGTLSKIWGNREYFEFGFPQEKIFEPLSLVKHRGSCKTHRKVLL